MENEILEIRISKALPNMVFGSKIKKVYFFEMPMPFKKILDLIHCFQADDVKYTGLLWDELPSSNCYHIKENVHLEKRYIQENEELLWEYDYGFLMGNNWELYYDFKGEVMLFGLSNTHVHSFEQELKNDEILMKYHYPLDDLLNYFESIATSNYNSPLDRGYADFLNKLKLNYSELASSVVI